MKFMPTQIPDVILIEPAVYRDDRGYFFESFQAQILKNAGISPDFLQDNESKSCKNVLRGLHFQLPPHTQGKLVRVLSGSVLDVAVDLRKNSSWYGKSVSQVLSGENKLMLWIPPGFAHGFLTLADETVFSYKCTGYYHKPSEASLRWNDPQLNIDWGVSAPLLSEKDRHAPLFNDFISPF